MYPILLQWNNLILPSWHAFYVLGAIATYYLLLHLRRKLYPELNIQVISNLFFICYFSGYFGARLFSIFNDQPDVTSIMGYISELFKLGPMTFYGGFIAAFVFGSLYLLLNRLPYAKIFDLGVISSLLGLAIGRIGCFLNGDDFGIPYIETPIPWWAVTFPNHEQPIPRYPIQLIETASILVLIFFLYLNSKRIKHVFKFGALGCFSAAGYAISRYFIEFYRGDERGWVIINRLSTSQFISILVLSYAVVYFALRKKQY